MTSEANLLAGRRVLIVEDDYFIATEMGGAFEASGAKVVGPIPSVEEAIELISASSDLDAAVLDINLRDVNSYPVADALQARSVPFVFASGYEKTVLPERFAHVPHCEKPVAPERLAQALFA